MRKKSKKPVGGVFASQDWSKKKVHFEKTPPNSKK